MIYTFPSTRTILIAARKRDLDMIYYNYRSYRALSRVELYHRKNDNYANDEGYISNDLQMSRVNKRVCIADDVLRYILLMNFRRSCKDKILSFMHPTYRGKIRQIFSSIALDAR